MAIIYPFKALRPQAQFAKQVASKPYDVLNSVEARKEARGNPISFLHVTKSEIDLREKTDAHSQDVYVKAKENLEAFVHRGVLFREEKPCYYIYELVMNGRSQTGLVCASSVDDYEENLIKKHELTRPDKELDRINHIKITGAQTGNVFLAYRNEEQLDQLIAQWKKNHSPVYDFTADDGITHRVWIINNNEMISQITGIFAKKIPETYIADGHHRAASAAKVRKELGDNITEGAEYFLTTLFPASQLQILDYNRVIKDLNGLEEKDLLKKISKKFEVEVADKPVYPVEMHEFGMYLPQQWYRLVSKDGTYDDEDPIGVLDITILQENILDPILGIKDQRTDKRIDFVGGIRGLNELEKRVNSGEMAVAFSLYPVSIDQLFDIADSGNVMPPKSTWFEPKLRDGLLTHLIYEP